MPPSKHVTAASSYTASCGSKTAASSGGGDYGRRQGKARLKAALRSVDRWHSKTLGDGPSIRRDSRWRTRTPPTVQPREQELLACCADYPSPCFFPRLRAAPPRHSKCRSTLAFSPSRRAGPLPIQLFLHALKDKNQAAESPCGTPAEEFRSTAQQKPAQHNMTRKKNRSRS